MYIYVYIHTSVQQAGGKRGSMAGLSSVEIICTTTAPPVSIEAVAGIHACVCIHVYIYNVYIYIYLYIYTYTCI